MGTVSAGEYVAGMKPLGSGGNGKGNIQCLVHPWEKRALVHSETDTWVHSSFVCHSPNSKQPAYSPLCAQVNKLCGYLHKRTKQKSFWHNKIRKFQTTHWDASVVTRFLWLAYGFLLSFNSLFQRLHLFCFDYCIYSTKLCLIFPVIARMTADLSAACLIPGIGSQCLSFLISLARTLHMVLFNQSIILTSLISSTILHSFHWSAGMEPKTFHRLE